MTTWDTRAEGRTSLVWTKVKEQIGDYAEYESSLRHAKRDGRFSKNAYIWDAGRAVA
jgi:hypothetical protein